jgi:hypothetical protein
VTVDNNAPDIDEKHTSALHLKVQQIPKERYEAKFVIPEEIAYQIRDYASQFTTLDPHCEGEPPGYRLTTLQLDSPDLALHHAKDRERYSRFKLRVRRYGNLEEDEEGPVFVEVKRKFKGVVAKDRARIPRGKWCKELITDPKRIVDFDFKSDEEALSFLEFVRLTRQIHAEPKVLIRYRRESLISAVDAYGRVTFDRQLQYQPTESWDSWGKGGHWSPIDTGLVQNKLYKFSGVVLEIKTLLDVPLWITDMCREFDLVRTGHCKYSNALWAESVFRGTTDLPSYASELLNL